jgi:hypothetical protein
MRASPRSRAASRTSRRSCRGRRAARRARRCRRRSRSRRECAMRVLHLAAGAEHLVQRQHRVVGRVIGVVAGRPIDRLAARVAHREIVGDRDRLVMRDEEAVLRAARRAPGAHARVGAGLQQIDRRLQPVSWVRPLSGIQVSCVPQPSSAGCKPSDTKPSTDQVLTNTSLGFGFFERCVSRSAMWMPLTPTCQRAPSPRAVFGSVKRCRWSVATLSSACLTNHDTMPGLAPQQDTAVVRRAGLALAASSVSRSA